MPSASAARVLKTIRLDPADHRDVRRLVQKYHVREADVMRTALKSGIVYLLNGEEEDPLLRKRLARRTKDIDGESFTRALKKEFKL